MRQLEQTINQVKKEAMGGKKKRRWFGGRKSRAKYESDTSDAYSSLLSRASPDSLTSPFSVQQQQSQNQDIQERLNDKLREVDVLMREKRVKLKNLDRLRNEFARVGVDIAQLQWELDYKKNYVSSVGF